MNYEKKQEWIEAVMADPRLTPATARYAFGIYKHMYGNKDTSWPGGKALTEATGLNDSQFYKYNRALVKAGYLEVTPRKGRSNEYALALPTSVEGEYPPSLEVHPPSEEVTPTSTGGTNTTKKTTRNTSMKDNKEPDADAPVDDSLPNYEVKDEATEVIELPLTTREQARGVAAASIFRTEEELRERRKRVLGL